MIAVEELDAAGYEKLGEMPAPEKIAAYYRSLLEKMKEDFAFKAPV